MATSNNSGATDGATRTETAYLERRGHVGILWLNRPDRLNAVNGDLCLTAGTILEEISTDPELRVCVISGVGSAFCAGADLKAIAAGEKIRAEGHPEWGFAGIVRHYIDKPVIAAVNGFALGGGTEILLACDLAVIDAEAKLGLPEVKRGLMAGAGGVLRLPSQVPPKIALEMALTGEPIGAETARTWGLVNRVAPHGQALAWALELAEAIAANAPVAVAASKLLIHRVGQADSDWDAGLWKVNQEELRRVISSEDAKEGPRAFAQKRAPVWSGR
jgi:crotonobetainyl-CoA hydratase